MRSGHATKTKDRIAGRSRRADALADLPRSPEEAKADKRQYHLQLGNKHVLSARPASGRFWKSDVCRW